MEGGGLEGVQFVAQHEGARVILAQELSTYVQGALEGGPQESPTPRPHRGVFLGREVGDGGERFCLAVAVPMGCLVPTGQSRRLPLPRLRSFPALEPLPCGSRSR